MTGNGLKQSFFRNEKNWFGINGKDKKFFRNIGVSLKSSFVRRLKRPSLLESRLDVVVNRFLFCFSGFFVKSLISQKKVLVNGNIVTSGS
jgi:ribosomal protein S4